MTTRTTYAQRLLEALEGSGLKDAEFCRRMGRSHGWVSNVRASVNDGQEHALLGPASVLAARILGVRHEWLALGEEPQRAQDAREALSAPAVYVGGQFDKIDDLSAPSRDFEGGGYAASVKTYAQRLIEALKDSGLTDAEFNRAMGKSLGFCHNIHRAVERGEDYVLLGPASAQAARILGVRHEWLALGEEPQRADGRDSLSPRAVSLAEAFDRIESPEARSRAYAMVIQLLDFSLHRPR